ncbi:neurexin-3b-like [Stylophora pistillata]|uniref:Neurexin-1 n=1 Tax=Stylophora pistillata TaxID=50429 RepID=A0A2B4RVN4_STYPI|nr:neurexin-3b-like [Stylophora pistillata]PFX20378.1 Neurexin-1 [Stylophora pistillata]
MLGGVVIFQLSFIASALASTGLRFTEEPAYAIFKRWNARRTGNLTFHFKTESKNGFLIYQDDKGQCQYIYLSMADGQLRLRLKMGNCELTQTLHVGHKLYDGRWHKVTVQRDSAVTRLTVDNLSNSTIYNGRVKNLIVKSDLIVGGIPWSTQLKLNDLSFPPIFYEGNHYGFNGCISRITYSVKRRRTREAPLKQTKGTTPGCLDPCSKTGKCKNGALCRYTFIEAHCDCKGTRFEGTNCSEETSSIWLNGSGYVVFRARQEADFDSNVNYLGFHLKTSYYHGVIFTLLSQDHYLLIEMVHGKLKVKLRLGQVPVVFSGRREVNDGEWHWVEFYRERDDFTLMIDHECNDTKKVSSRYFKPKMLYVAGGPRNVLMKSDSKQNYSGYLQEFYFGKKKIFDSIVPTITDRRFAKIGTVIDGSITFEGSGGSGCLLLGDDEDEECPKTEISTTTTVELTSTTTQPTTEQVPKPVPTGVPALKSLPQVVPFWVISAIVVVAAIAISVTLFFLYRWNSRYSGSFKPKSSSSSCMSSPKHGAFVINPRIHVTLHDDRM